MNRKQAIEQVVENFKKECESIKSLYVGNPYLIPILLTNAGARALTAVKQIKSAFIKHGEGYQVNIKTNDGLDHIPNTYPESLERITAAAVRRAKLEIMIDKVMECAEREDITSK
jgi:hypothetical protein